MAKNIKFYFLTIVFLVINYLGFLLSVLVSEGVSPDMEYGASLVTGTFIAIIILPYSILYLVFIYPVSKLVNIDNLNKGYKIILILSIVGSIFWFILGQLGML